MIGVTITRYFAMRFMRTILAIFFTIFCLTFVVVFVETLRRASDNPAAGAGTVALMTAMKVPAAAEMILPFAVLFGSMATFVDLTRKLELIVARAAGMSVWQFIMPAALTALIIGLFSVAIYNPLSAIMKMRSDQMEFELFGQPGSVRMDHGVWMRQHGVDGAAVLHAMNAANGGVNLQGVSVNVYAPTGIFVERIEAATAHLEPGVWVLEDAPWSARPANPRGASAPICSRPISPPNRRAAAATPPQGTPFWSLPRRRATDRARPGSTPPEYRLQFQTLLARPLLLIAMVLVSASFSLRFFRFGGIAKTLSGGVVAGLRALHRDESPVGSRRRGHDQSSRRRLVACACREHVGHAYFALFGGRLMRFRRLRYLSALMSSAAAILGGANALAQPSTVGPQDAGARMVVEAKEMVYDEKKNIVTAQGQVQIYLQGPSAGGGPRHLRSQHLARLCGRPRPAHRDATARSPAPTVSTSPTTSRTASSRACRSTPRTTLISARRAPSARTTSRPSTWAPTRPARPARTTRRSRAPGR